MNLRARISIAEDYFLHIFNRPSTRMLSWCSKFEIFKRVIISNSILVMNGKALVSEPHHRFFSHRMFLVQGKPMLVNRIPFCERMSSHPQNQGVPPRCFSKVSIAGIFYQIRLLHTSHAKLGNSLICISSPEISNQSAARTFAFYTPTKQYSSAWMAHVFRASHIARILEFVTSNHSFISTFGTAHFPSAISVPVGKLLNRSRSLSSFVSHKSVVLICATLLGRQAAGASSFSLNAV